MKKEKKKELLPVNYHYEIDAILGHLKLKSKEEQEFIVAEVMRGVGMGVMTQSTVYQVRLV